MIAISFDAECVNQHTAPDIAALSRDERFCVGITGDMAEEQHEILEAQHVPVTVPGETRPRIAPPLLLWSRLLSGDDKAATLRKIGQRVSAHRLWHVVNTDPVDLSFVDAPDWLLLTMAQLAEKLRAA